MNNLRKLDLNQLVTLHALLRERHVSRAALSLHKSQPAVSHTLNQLRELFHDPLLIRQNGQYQLTSKAEALYSPLKEALMQLDNLIAQQDFQPKDYHRRFNLVMSDYGAATLAPKLIAYLREHAPNIEIQIGLASREEMQSQLQTGSVDIAFGVFHSLDYTLHAQTIFTDNMMSVMAKKYCSNGEMTLEKWLSFPHILVSMKPFDANEIEVELQRLNRQRNIAVTLPYWQIAPQLIEDTDLILTVAQKALPKNISDNIVVFSPPITIPTINFQMIWHQRSDADAALIWLRGVIVELTLAEFD